jgi:predicted ArsR family transcriptional regulator
MEALQLTVKPKVLKTLYKIQSLIEMNPLNSLSLTFEELATEAGVSLRTAKNHVQELQENELLFIEKEHCPFTGKQSANTYYLYDFEQAKRFKEGMKKVSFTLDDLRDDEEWEVYITDKKRLAEINEQYQRIISIGKGTNEECLQRTEDFLTGQGV